MKPTALLLSSRATIINRYPFLLDKLHTISPPFIAANCLLPLLLITFTSFGQDQAAYFEQARKNAEKTKGLPEKLHQNMQTWVDKRDPETGLMLRRLPEAYGQSKGFQLEYTVKDVPADLYPFLVLTASFTDQELYESYMHEFLTQEIKLTTGKDGLPADALFQPFRLQETSLESRIFGASEYVKDGLTPVLEWLGKNNGWYYRMQDLVEAIYKTAPVQTIYGTIPSGSAEVNGEMLQTLCRLYGATGDEKYLERARAIGDAYIFEVMVLNHGLPSHQWDFEQNKGEDMLQLRDHGCEIIGGLSLLFALEADMQSARGASYYLPIKNMLDRLSQCRYPNGLFPNKIKCSDLSELPLGNQTGRLNDNWGYLYTAWWDFYVATGEKKYLDMIREGIAGVAELQNANWEGQYGADGFADAIEGALEMLNRIPDEALAQWIDSETAIMAGKQKDAGYIEGWYGDGNWNRTLLMYLLWKSKGCYLDNWKGVMLGAHAAENNLYLTIRADQKWVGRLKCDIPRHQTIWQFPQNYARINEFPEWFTVQHTKLYTLTNLEEDTEMVVTGAALVQGVRVSLKKGEEKRFIISPYGQ